MYLILRYPSGRLADAILLAAGPDRMRVVVKRLNETLELHRTDGQWFSDTGEKVSIEGWINESHQVSFDFSAVVPPRTLTATH